MESAKSISVIGGADGPTSVFLVGHKEENIFRRFRMYLRNKKYRRKRKKVEKSIVPGAHTMEETVLYMRQHYGAVEADDSYPDYAERKENMRGALIWRTRPELLAVVEKICPPEDFSDAQAVRNRYHLVVHVWIKNSKGQYLISQRSANRPTFPLMWECVGGSVLKGENSLQGAIREVKEEVGIDLIGVEGRVVFSKVRDVICDKKFNDILDVWLFAYDGDVSLEGATTDEVAQSRWLYPEQIKELYNSKYLVSTLEYFFDEIAV